jgi:hypothetical protein
MREQTDSIMRRQASGSAHQKGMRLICDGPGNLSTGRDY